MDQYAQYAQYARSISMSPLYSAIVWTHVSDSDYSAMVHQFVYWTYSSITTRFTTCFFAAVRKPQFLEQLQNITVPEGKSAVLKCSFSAEPPPQIQWLRNGAQVLPSAVYKVEAVKLCFFLKFSLIYSSSTPDHLPTLSRQYRPYCAGSR